MNSSRLEEDETIKYVRNLFRLKKAIDDTTVEETNDTAIKNVRKILD